MNNSNKQEIKSWLTAINAFRTAYQESSPEFSSDFKQKVVSLKPHIALFERAISLAEMYDVDDSFMNSLVQPWGSIAHVLQSAPNYRRADDPQGDRMKSMVTSIDQFVSQIATQYPAQNQSTMIFPALFAYLSALEVRHLEDPAEQSAQLKQAQAEFVSLTNKLKDTIADASIDRFANIFGVQALKHSRLLQKASGEKEWYHRLRVGAAELWLTVGTCALVAGGYYFFKNFGFESVPKEGSWEKFIPYLTEKLIFLTLWFYVVRFSFRNFALNKNFSVLNSHRQNVLNSFRLFHQTLDTEDRETKAKILSEVAKSIYFQGPTGYLAEKGPALSNSAIMELIKRKS